MSNWQEYTRSYLLWDENNIKGFFGYGQDEYEWLSNFNSSPVMYGGVEYPSVENAYQAQKVIYNLRLNFVYCSAKESKELWKKFERVDADSTQWDLRKYDVMLACIFDKFWRNRQLRDKLVNTNDKFLEETNHWHDNYWGNCICPKCKDKEGKNMLGKSLMSVRGCFQNE